MSRAGMARIEPQKTRKPQREMTVVIGMEAIQWCRQLMAAISSQAGLILTDQGLLIILMFISSS